MRTFREIFRFELRQQLRSPLFWMVAIVLAALAFTAVGSDHLRVGGGVGNVHRNSPYATVELLGNFTLFGMFLIPMFVATAALRDFEAGTAELFFATPISRKEYLGGRFAAGFAASVAMMAVIAIAMLLGVLMPWADPARMGPTPWAAFFWAFGVIVLPCLLFLSGFVFLLATSTRSMLSTYVGVIGFFMLYTLALVAMRDIDHVAFSALIDPTGSSAFDLATRYWSASERNTRLPGVDGVLLANRAIWIAFGLASIAAAFAWFRPEREGPQRRKRAGGSLPDAASVPAGASVCLPVVRLRSDASARWRQFFALAWFDTRGVISGVPFLVMLAIGLLSLGATLWLGGQHYGTQSYPVTHRMNETMDATYTFMLMIIVIFYAGELVWRERSSRVAEVTDAFALPDSIPLLSKLVAIGAVIVLFLLAGCCECAIYQISRDYTRFEPGLYLANLALTALGFLLAGALALFLQVMSNNKFLGYLLAVLYLVSKVGLDQLGFGQHLYDFGSAPELLYSDMNGYGHFLAGHLWFRAYWSSLAVAMLVVASLFRARGAVQGWKERVRVARQRFRTPSRVLLATSMLAFCGLGGWIYWNTNILNRYVPDDVAIRNQADYEKRYRRYLALAQPKISDVRIDMDFYPHERRFDVRGHYVLINRTHQPITDLHVRTPVHSTTVTLKFAAHDVVSDDRTQGYAIYRLRQPLPPGASMDFDFVEQYWSRGFRNTSSDTQVVDNGSFVNSTMFPHFGYSEDGELTDRNDRRSQGLGEPHVMPKIGDVAAHQSNLLDSDADWVNFEATLSTVPDQIALAPGYLVREWSANGRRYFHYRMDRPINCFFSFQSARYAVRHDHYRDVAIEVYFDPQHRWNIDRIIDASKKSLAHYEAVYSPYQFRQLRVLEFPGYRTYAESFANTIPESESYGFITDLRNPDDIDYVFDLIAHEIAHQWWGHQVIGANVQGATMLDETFAQYSALMVDEAEYGPAKMRKFLQYELDEYLRGRGSELVGELPLALNEDQPYIHYNKGSVVMYALKDYLGGATVDRALARFDRDYAFKGPPYPDTRDFLADLRAEAGAKWSPLISDLFDKVTIFDNRVTSATFRKRADGRYEVTVKIHAGKAYVDSLGKETPGTLDEPVDIGVFARAADGKEQDEKVLYLSKQTVASGDSSVTVTVDAEPWEAGIDPYNKLVDRVSSDNRMRVSQR